MSVEVADVLVVGGGPAGATAAFQLARAGIAVTLVDRACFPRDKTCGESLSPGALNRLQAIGMWRPSEGAGTVPPSPVLGMRVRSPRGTSFAGHYRPGGATGVAYRRALFDEEMLTSAKRAGVRVIEGVEVTSTDESSAGRASVGARLAQGHAPLRFAAKRVIVADGRRSFLARQLGFLELETPATAARRYAVRAHFAQVAGLSNLAEMHVGNRGYCGIAPLSKTRANVCYVSFDPHVELRPGALETGFLKHIERYPQIADRLAGSVIEGAIRVTGPLRLRSKRQQRGPFIACGDTTGFLDPFTGEGIAHAVASGTLAATAVRDSLDGAAKAFAAYEEHVRALRRVKGSAALVLYTLVSRRVLADSTAALLARAPRLADALVRLFGDQV